MGNSSHVRSSTSKAGFRTPRLEHLLREELNFLFESEIGDPLLADLQVEHVHLSHNAALATVYVFHSPPPSHAKVAQEVELPLVVTELSPPMQKALVRATAFLRSRLSDVLPLKRSPELRFKPGLPRTGALFYSDEELL